MRVLSTFSGISAASAAWKPLRFEFVGYADIDPFAAHALHHRCGAGRPIYMPSPDEEGIDDKEARIRRNAIKAVSNLPDEGVPNFGDISQITDDDLRRLGRVDVLEGGSPCQSFSTAGKRRGLEDDRGNLMLEFCGLAERMRVINGLIFVVWENVKGVLSDKTNGFGCLLASLAGEQGCALQSPGKIWPSAGHVAGIERRKIAWRVLDAQHFGVPQRRKRVFAVASFADECPGEILFERESMQGNPQEVGAARKETPGRLAGSSQDKSVYGIVDDESVASDLMPTIAARKTSGGMAPAVAHALRDRGSREMYSPDHLPTLRAAGGDQGGGSEAIVVSLTEGQIGSANDNFDEGVDWIVRRLTPVECERLQGFPDNWTDIPYRGGNPAADGPRYKALGNSMAVPCMLFIGEKLFEITSEKRSHLEHKAA